ncbi:nuclear transport factor 2 family protein [Williamsia soli]|uniref:nuclear transport factor 2 family protein n=1 Tax=Williamsia soli TaxID=364929 RepID=UPI001A9F4A7B|nr:nuclear transport factor 2 family protein [Williamsia soli]
MEQSEAVDIVEIGQLLDNFVIGMDRLFGIFPIRIDRDAADGVLDMFLPEGILHTPFGRAEGRQAINKGWERVAALEMPSDGPEYIQHHVTSREIRRVDPTTAYTFVYVQALTDRGLDHWGTYEDRIVKVADGWKFAERLVSVQGWVPGGYYSGMPNPQNPVRHW